jgi:tripartite-type tricarboxylate transporter receptor subunit TctC
MTLTSITRRRFAQWAGAGIAAATVAPGVFAQASAWPAKPITFVVGFPPGGITDVVARMVAQGISEELKQPVLVDNRSGAGGTIAASYVAAAPKDGYTLLVIASGHVHNKLLLKGVRYDPLNDFEPIGGIARNQLVVMVNSSSPYQSMQDLVAGSKKGNGITYAAGGVGTMEHLIMEALAARSHGRFVNVQYRGAAPAVQDLMGGQVDTFTGLLQTSLQYVEGGKLRALAVTGRDRSPLLPNVPTLSETVLPGYDAQGYFGLLGPAGLPKPVVARLNEALAKVMHRADVVEKLRAGGGAPMQGTPAEFLAFIRDDGKRWSELITSLNIQPQ